MRCLRRARTAVRSGAVSPSFSPRFRSTLGCLLLASVVLAMPVAPVLEILGFAPAASNSGRYCRTAVVFISPGLC
ncbi:hypothetical protein BJV77DRAFT_1025946, partial [Russula vinacea]